MSKYFKNKPFVLAIAVTTILSTTQLSGQARKSYTAKPYSPKNCNRTVCPKKAPYAGYGKLSQVNGLPKTKTISGHVKKTTQGHTYVNPYARSK